MRRGRTISWRTGVISPYGLDKGVGTAGGVAGLFPDFAAGVIHENQSGESTDVMLLLESFVVHA